MFVFILCLVMSLSMLSCSNDDANGVGQSQDDFRLVHLNFSSQSNGSVRKVGDLTFLSFPLS